MANTKPPKKVGQPNQKPPGKNTKNNIRAANETRVNPQ